VISETPCSPSTEKNIEIARRGAEARLNELGLSRSDLTSAHRAEKPWATSPPPWRAGAPPAGNVVSLRRCAQGDTTRRRTPRV
jgi:hypothetical protein